MRRKALVAALCCLMLNETSAKVVQTAYGVGFIDSISAESAPRLYKDIPVGVYASANPYAAYSFHAPTLVAPKDGQVIPVKEESVMVQNTNGYLKDSYGQRFVEAPQTIAYKAVFPQQFVQLQNLPAHLSQPLVAATNFQYGQGTPHFFQQSQFRTPTLQALAPSPLHQFTASPFVYANNVRSFAISSPNSQAQGNPTAQQQSSSNKNVYVNNLSAERFNKLQNEPKFQRLQEGAILSAASNNNNKQSQAQQNLQLVQVPKQTSITTVINGKKTVVNLVTKPPVPLLDLTLLEPLTFDNPLVPQVQHFLPRINQVKYKKLPELNQVTYKQSPEINEVKKHQMEFIVQNTKSYDSGNVKAKPKQKKKHKKPVQNQEIDEIEVHSTPTLTNQDIPEDSPEIVYEINTPNYKETISEKKISYNKKTGSEPVSISYDKQTNQKPVHYSYEMRTAKKPVHYSFTSTSKEPAKLQKSYAEIKDEPPKQLIYHFNAEEKSNQQPNQQNHSPPAENESEKSPDENSEDVDKEETPEQNEPDDGRQEYYDESSKAFYDQPEHRQQQNDRHNQNDESANLRSDPPQQRQVSHKPHTNEEHFQPIVPEYEEDITILPAHKPHAPLKSDQHPKHHHYDNRQNHNSEPPYEQGYDDYSKSQYSSSPDKREKSERIIVKEGTTAEAPNEELVEQREKKEDNEEDFEVAYKNAAFGFPAYDAPFVDVEKEIYNPESYGSSRYHNNYNVRNSPLRQYEADGDDYPHYTRSKYKDARDKTTDNYFLDYAVSRPESLAERHKQKEDYYEVYTQHKPEKYFAKDNNDEENKKAKHTASSLHGYYAKPQQKQQSSKYKTAPKFEEYSYRREAPHDNSAHATRPQQLYKIKTQFVEPQYQYGFEPLSIPRLLDSEIAAMASNVRYEINKPGIRQKNYKTNWHNMKTNLKINS